MCACVCMCAYACDTYEHVPLTVAVRGEVLVADGAGIRAARRVHAAVRYEPLAHAEALAARVARERPFTRVRPAVVAQQRRALVNR